MKKIYKSYTDKVFAGVIGGVGEYFEVDPTILRLIYVLILVMTGIFPGVIGYIIAAAIVPHKPKHSFKETTYAENKNEEPKTENA